MNPQVTIIIPVFKAEKDIERCCRALVEQTLDSIEYIFVNDCTPDGSVAVIEKTLAEYPKRISDVKILHQPQNMGVSACRQLGLNNATGEYVIHCDIKPQNCLIGKLDTSNIYICDFGIAQKYRSSHTGKHINMRKF